jgi:translation initiation factor 1
MFEMGAKFDDGWSVEESKKEKQVSEKKSFEKHQLVFAKEKRRGKIVTIVKPFYLDKKELQSLLKTLKKSLATGGSLKENTLEFQGDIKERLLSELVCLGFGMKR